MSTAVEPVSQIHTSESLVSDITPGPNTATPKTLIQEQEKQQDQTQQEAQQEQQHHQDDNAVSNDQKASEHTKKTTITAVVVPQADLDAELTFCKERLEAIETEERTGADPEKIALEEAEIDALAKASSEKEHQWSATKEVYHREFGAIVEDTAKPVTVVKGS
ncbi:hypothetical protein BGZ95_011347 [Linnemannia exigua]|uniref:Uncharacterized protein n=1 Tax=Linnemannia exigua TaxID=604196 RepID=A0AAD4H4B7_9FUNG|nr:hypothetical protein BGZ95_011347 [Linnemannia exigua]